MTAVTLIPETQRAADALRDEAVLDALIASIGNPRFAVDALAALNEPLRAASWSVYRLWRDRAPVLHLSASCGVADTTQHCFAAYRDGLYRRDSSFDLVRGDGSRSRALVLHMRAADAPSAEHRERIYQRHGLAERLSVAAADDDDSLLAVNLYQHEHQGRFTATECERFCRIAPLVLASVRRHLALSAPPAVAAESPRACMRAACPSLTERELDVCERLLRGLSHDGVAADLGLSVATVKTYRARAFARLGLHFRSQLFARFGCATASVAQAH